MLLTAGTKMTIQVKVTQEDPMDGYYDLSIYKLKMALSAQTSRNTE